jgi:hypothetical protein
MANRSSLIRNEFRSAVETNQSGKLCVRLQAHFGRNDWTLSVYFLASSLNRALKKLEQVVQFLQRNEEKLHFWGVERSADWKFTEEFLSSAGVKLDRRKEFPKRAASMVLAPEKPAPAFLFAPMRRCLAEAAQSDRARATGD